MRSLYTFFMVSVSTFALAQVTFNMRYSFDFLGAVASSVVPVEDGYYMTGIVSDTIAPYNLGCFFTKTDLNGHPIFLNTIKGSSFEIGTWFNTLALLPDSTFVLSSTHYDSLEKTMFLRMDIDGDTLFTKKFVNPAYPEYEVMQPTGGMERLPDGTFLVSNWFHNGPENAQSQDVYILRLEASGDTIWSRTFHSLKNDKPTSMVVDSQTGNAIIGLLTTNFNQVWQDYSSQVRLIELSPSGEVLWDYTTSESIGLRDAPNDMVRLGDGSLVIASGEGTEIERPTGNTIWFEKLLFKLSPDGEILWETPFPDPDFNSQSKLTNVVEISDGSGFIVAGQQGDYVNNTYHHVRGWVSKVNHQGQVDWERAFVGVDSEDPKHEIFDLKECPDGGYILAGESQDGTWQSIPPQQAWLLKLDEHGCLVPGCHLPNNVGEVPENSVELAIYPNPTVDYLNFQLRGNNDINDGMFRIVNSDGKVMKEFIVDIREGDTFVVQVWEWPMGAYFLQLIDPEATVIISKKFIKN
ncbi:MAG: T9SS type A sorting domain-containing protein [Bacteroidota bacterium]